MATSHVSQNSACGSQWKMFSRWPTTITRIPRARAMPYSTCLPPRLAFERGGSVKFMTSSAPVTSSQSSRAKDARRWAASTLVLPSSPSTSFSPWSPMGVPLSEIWCLPSSHRACTSWPSSRSCSRYSQSSSLLLYRLARYIRIVPFVAPVVLQQITRPNDRGGHRSVLRSACQKWTLV